MSWNKVQLDLGNEKINAFLKHDESQLCLENIIELGDSVKVNKKDYKVLSSTVDHRDNLLTIDLAKASKPKKKEKKSDDKQTKG